MNEYAEMVGCQECTVLGQSMFHVKRLDQDSTGQFGKSVKKFYTSTGTRTRVTV